MTFAEIRAEVQARGFDYVTPTSRIDRWINRTYQRICDRQAWPFLETTTSGTAPLTISDLRAVFSVVDTSTDATLSYEDYRTLRDDYGDLTTAGSPSCWYLDGDELKTFATSSNTLDVRYLKVPAELSADDDEPVLPERYHYLLVDGACIEAYKDSDNIEAFLALRDDYEQAMVEMESALLVVSMDSSPGVLVVD